ncbi:MAG: hypothetical protein R6T98_07670, partial [Desulfatiglandales bacterium]
MGFFEVTGGRGVSFRNVSVGEPAAPSLSRGMRRASGSESLPLGEGKTPPWIRYEKTLPFRQSLQKSPSSFDKARLY